MDQTVIISSAGEQLKNFGDFLHNYDRKLGTLLKTYTGLNITPPQKTINPPIELNYSTDQEQLPLLKLLESERLLNKTLLTFAHLCAEVELIVQDAQQMQVKFLYIDENLCTLVGNSDVTVDIETTQYANERILLEMSSSVEFLCNMHFLIQRCIMLGNNLLHQCSAFLATDSGNLEFNFCDVLDYLTKLLLQLLVFDELLSNSNFRRFWPNYKKTVKAIARNSDSIDITASGEMNGLQNCLLELDFLFSGIIFRNFLDSTFSLKDQISPKGLGQLIQQFNDYMKQSLALVDKIQSQDLDDFNESHLLVCLNAFCVVFHEFCGQVEMRHVKHLLELNAKHQGIMLLGNVSWNAAHFLKKHAETLITPHGKLIQDSKRVNRQFLQSRVHTLSRDCRTYCSQVLIWTLNVEEALQNGPFDLKVDEFRNLATLLLVGLRYAGQISFLIRALVNAHITLVTPMTKSTLLSVCKLIELLKMIQETLQKETKNIAKVMQCILQYLQYKIIFLLGICKRKITSSKLRDHNVDALAAIKIAEKCMNGPPTQARILTAKLAINATNLNNCTMIQDQYNRFKSTMRRIQLLCNFQLHAKRVCNTSFIYWHQSILCAYLKQIVDKKMDVHAFQYLLISANECVKSFESLQLSDLKVAEILKKTNYENVRNEIISNLCGQIETFLRLEVHSALQLDKMKPFEQSINDYRDLLNMCPVEINGHYVILKDYVENYLSCMFYNLTTISLHDWKKYEEMRHLANNRLCLKPVDDYLPNQTLDQGLDILEIMRNIHVFVSKYVYNMNAQIFVEEQSANKHLDSIGIRHVANSLRTHGSGVINTTVNFTYQFLRQKFYTFSQFLYDEQIRSRLMKELRSYANRKQEEQYPLYPYERADAFNKDIRKLGLSNDNQTYMDLFRKVITHIGNAMGYIRLVRSGNIHANYSASLYLPKFDENLRFVELCRECKMHEVTIAAAENFEASINNLANSFSDSTDYFKLLLNAFYPFFQNSHNMHLKNFFLIVPPLILNHVEYMLNVKDKINKKDRQKTVLFDDGFAVGLTYILKLLNQIDDFNALQWFNTIRDRFTSEQQKVKEMLTEINSPVKGGVNVATQKDENMKLQQTLALTERRISAHQMEYNLVFHNLSCAKIFFK